MNPRTVVGLTPWLPGVLGRSAWWTEPVRAERLAAFRIGMAAVLLLDIFWMYLPRAFDFFGQGSLGSPEVFAARTVAPSWRWSLLQGVHDPRLAQAILLLWAGAAFCLLIGLFPRLAAVGCWAMAMSVYNQIYYIHNSGDNVRSIGLFYLMFCPSGAAWSVTSWRWKGPVYVPAWPLRLLFIQLMLIYFLNGWYKLGGGDWQNGTVMHYVLGNVAWTRFAYAQLPMPEFAVPLMTYTTLLWELTFPVGVLMPMLRRYYLWLGVLFHVGTGVLLQLAMFPFYMLCLYLPLVPWEDYADRWRDRLAHVPSTARDATLAL
jgi:uncharacterized membrane protein YphA (DoxX/SURF4 family)